MPIGTNYAAVDMFGGPVGIARRLHGTAARFDRAPRSRVLLPAVVRQLSSVPFRVVLTLVLAVTSARPQTDDETR